MPRNKRVVTIYLAGGVGNQLFQYFAGKYVAMKNRCDLLIDTSRIGVGGSNHGSEIFHFTIPEQKVYSKFRNVIYRSWVWRAHHLMLRKNRGYGLLAKSILQDFYSRELDYDLKLEDLKAPISLTGYFQTRAYYDLLKNSGMPRLELKNPSAWYFSTRKLILENQSLAIHIRRGDYGVLKDSFGLLSKSYYLNAVKEIEKRFSFTQVLIFTDDINSAREMNLGFGLTPVHFIEPPPESEAVESLMLMSAAQGIVLSNSTFAWWSAVIGETKHVIAPMQWFKSLEGPKNLLEDNWIRLNSEWES